MAYLCDVNFLLALTAGRHEHHGAVNAWTTRIHRPAELLLCRFTQLAFLRLLNNPSVMGPQVCRGMDAWRTYDLLLSDHRFAFRSEPPGLDSALRRFTASFAHSPKAWQDAYLAAFAASGSLTLVTLDSGMSHYSEARVERVPHLPGHDDSK